MARPHFEWPSFLQVKPIVQWPGDLTPHGRRRGALFSAGFSSTVNLLGRELEQLTKPGQRRAVLQMALTARDIRLDGYPRAGATPTHPGVIVSIESTHGPLSYPADSFDHWQDNLRGIALALEALRKVDRYGVTKNGQQYRGWAQLGAGPTESSEEAAAILYGMAYPDSNPEECEQGAREILADRDKLMVVYRRAARRQHPDSGTGDEKMWEQFRKSWDIVKGAGG